MDGITPTYNIGGNNDGFFGGNGLWLFAILALMWGGNGFGFGGNNLGYRPATAEDVNNGFNFNDLQNQNRDIITAINAGTAQAVATTNQLYHDTIGAFNDKYSELQRDIAALQVGQANLLAKENECCCATLRAIDGVNYNNAMNMAAIKELIIADGQKTRDLQTANRFEAMQDRIRQLELNQALNGVVRYPSATTYTSGSNPFCACSGCGFNN